MTHSLNVSELGQVFSPKDIVEKMISLSTNKNGLFLEPSCGDGAFVKELINNKIKFKSIEFDQKVAHESAAIMDFFDFNVTNKFDCIIGNPPYVRNQSILKETKDKLEVYKDIFDQRTNLYHYFIYKSILHLNPHGELIFIVPRDFLKSTSCIKMNEFLYSQGTITDIFETGDEKIFKNAVPNCVIFRFQKDNFSRITNGNLKFSLINGMLCFLSKDYVVKFSDLFFVKVGAVSGADEYFISEKGNMDFVFSETIKTKKTRRMFYNIEAEELKQHKNKLISRRIRKFSERNWFEWGRGFHISESGRIYVNCKTRNKNPFFTHDCKNYDGSVLAIFPKKNLDIKKCVEMLNNVNWEELGFICDGRYIFSQRSLENIYLPIEFNIFIE